MKFDIFFAICQTEVDGFMPDETTMWRQFFSQVQLADELGFGVAWVAETHLSCEIQKQLPTAVIPHFKGEIGLNTDILQLAHKIFARTKRIEVGSAIRNILCNGGPIAHAEAVRTFLAMHGLEPSEKRRLHIGFASGRFDFSNRPYGLVPRNALEKQAWPVIKGKILQQATEIFLRLLRGDLLSSEDVAAMTLRAEDFRTPEDWQKVASLAEPGVKQIEVPTFWPFEKLGVIPRDVRRELLSLTIGTHDAATQVSANQILPVGVFNLSITPPEVIDATHRRMSEKYHRDGGPWRRDLMPRTVMVFIDEDRAKAKARAKAAYENYWRAMEGTLDSKKVEQAVGNALVGTPKDIIEQIRSRYQPEDRVMLWFDFNIHDNDLIENSMRAFMRQVAPEFQNGGAR
ncbi:MAG: LLM class flavin-dependent oxidoreductase [Bdellovibrionales bacterium]